METENIFTFADMKKIKRSQLGNEVPLELFRAIRLIGIYQGLPLGGRGTTATIGRKIGESMPVTTVEEFLKLFEELKIGIPQIIHEEANRIRISVEDCFCEGLPITEGKKVCDLEGSIMEGALSKIWNKRVTVREDKCNVNGDERCEYDIRF